MAIVEHAVVVATEPTHEHGQAIRLASDSPSPRIDIAWVLDRLAMKRGEAVAFLKSAVNDNLIGALLDSGSVTLAAHHDRVSGIAENIAHYELSSHLGVRTFCATRSAGPMPSRPALRCTRVTL